MGDRFSYDRLTVEQKKRLAAYIAEDNQLRSESFYPEPAPKDTFYTRYGKRVLDILIAIPALVFFFPINLIIGIITFFDVGMPVFFRQERMGKNGRLFTLTKFRNMTDEKDENGVLLRAEQRVTRWGRFVRSASLDELLNFVPVLKGDMSIIGPRPLPELYRGRFNRYHNVRHSVRPGLDCPLRDPTKYMTWANRLENDAWYAQNISFGTDLKMVYLLVKEVFFGKDKENRAEGFYAGSFAGYCEDGSVMDSNHIPDEYFERLFSEECR